MKRLLGMVAGLMLLSAPANAVVISNLGPDPTSAAGHFSNAPGGGVFFDQYTFQLLLPSYIAVVTASNTFASGGINGPNGIANFTGAIYRIVGTIDAAPGGNDEIVFGPQAATLCGSQLCQQLDGNGIIAAGNYYLALAGNAGSTAGYGGDLSVTPTPIPGSALLFGSVLAGGLWLRRRRNRLV